MLHKKKAPQIEEMNIRRALEAELGHICVREELITQTLRRAENCGQAAVVRESAECTVPVQPFAVHRLRRLTAAAASLLVLLLGVAVIGFGLHSANTKDMAFNDSAAENGSAIADQTGGQMYGETAGRAPEEMENGISDEGKDAGLIEPVSGAGQDAGEDIRFEQNEFSEQDTLVAESSTEEFPYFIQEDRISSEANVDKEGAEKGKVSMPEATMAPTATTVPTATTAPTAAVAQESVSDRYGLLSAWSKAEDLTLFSYIDDKERETAVQFLALLTRTVETEVSQELFAEETVRYRIALLSEDSEAVTIYKITESAYISTEVYVTDAILQTEDNRAIAESEMLFGLEKEAGETLLHWLELRLPEN